MYRRVKRANTDLSVVIPKDNQLHAPIGSATTPIGSPIDGSKRSSIPMKTFKQKIMNSLNSVSDAPKNPLGLLKKRLANKDMVRDVSDSDDEEEEVEIIPEEITVDGDCVPPDLVQTPQKDREYSPYSLAEIYWPLELLQHGISFIDTPGLNENALFDSSVESYLPHATAIIIVVDATSTVTATLKRMLERIRGKLTQISVDVFVVVNKIDILPKDEVSAKEEYLFNELVHYFPSLKKNRSDYFHSVSSYDVIKHLQHGDAYPPAFLKLQKSLVNFMVSTFRFKLEVIHMMLDKHLHNCDRFVRQTITNSKRSKLERRLLSTKFLDFFDQINQQIVEWERSCHVKLQSYKKVLGEELETFWNSAQVFQSLKQFITQWRGDYNFVPLMKEHVKTLFFEFYSGVLHHRLEQRKQSLLDLSTNPHLTAAIFKLNRVKRISDIRSRSNSNLELTNEELEKEESNNVETSTLLDKLSVTFNNTSISFKPDYVQQFKHYYKYFSGETMIEQVIRAPIVFPITALIVPIINAMGYVHYDEKTIESYAKSIIKRQVKKKNLKKAIGTCINPLESTVQDVLFLIRTQIEQEAQLLKRSLGETRSEVEVTKSYTVFKAPIQKQIKELLEYKQLFIEETWNIDVNNLVIGEMIDHGAFGQVFRVTMNDKVMAMKLIKYPESLPSRERLQVKERFLNEVSILIQAQHHNIVRFEGANFSDTDGIMRIFLELCESGNLRQYLKRQVSIQKRLSILMDIATAMEFLHDHNIIHRDLKPSNILVDKDENIKITDFGNSKIQDMIATSVVGTSLYMAPELLEVKFLTVVRELVSND
jgi:tRNA A-37 threonylcarbamoyl transferase component Bud32/signal recognition particle receptor subunit beta